MAKFELNFEELEDVIKDLERAGGNVKEATEKALIESHAYITPLIESKLNTTNLPSKGKYSSDDREHSLKQLIREPNVIWVGDSCFIDVGFKLDETIVPIFLIRGTSNMKPVTGLKSLLEGKKTQKEITEIQMDVLLKEIETIF